jgi:agmatine deiminase
MTGKVTLTNSNPADAGYYMPAEWQAHSRCWMVWPSENEFWGEMSEVEDAYAQVANTIARFEPVSMVVNPDDIDSARAGLNDNVEVLPMPTDDSWMRDTGPSFLKHRQSGEIAGTAWRFNCWGGHIPHYQEDAQIAGRVLAQQGQDCYRSSLTLEGGGLHVDGDGTLVTTESVVLNPNRNWGMDRQQAELELCRATGARNIIWLPGDPDGETSDMTDGHVDGIMCFIKPGVVLFEKNSTADEVEARLERENRRALELATDARGRKLQIIDMEISHSGIGEEHDMFCSSYINFYLPNGALVMPAYGVPSDQLVRDFLGNLFSDRLVEMVNINAIAPAGGGIHCITQQQPA